MLPIKGVRAHQSINSIGLAVLVENRKSDSNFILYTNHTSDCK